MIYFVTAREVGRVKIGHSRSPVDRFNQIQSSSPVFVALERVIEGDLELESKIHDRFSDYRIKGEWFDIVPAIEQYMDGLPKYSKPKKPEKSVTMQFRARSTHSIQPELHHITPDDVVRAASFAGENLTTFIKKAGVSPSAFYRWRNGDREIRPLTKAKLADAMVLD